MDFKNRYQYHPRTDLLGKGGFARVFKAYDTLLERDVALKVFNTEASTKYDLVSEIKKVIKLEHPNLCRYYDVAFVESVSAFNEEEKHQVGIMEYIDGGELKAYIATHPGSLDGLLKGILQGLAFLHRKHIVHRDMKPANILVKNTEDGPVAKITDFGISKDTDSSNTGASQLMGTIEYMAPEQFNPGKYGIDGRIGTNLDLWSFGVMLFELATPGQKLFATASTEQMMNNILNEEQVSLRLINLPQPYQRMAQRCLVKDARERAQHAEELIAILDGTDGATAPIIVKPRAPEADAGATQDLSRTMEYGRQLIDPNHTVVPPRPQPQPQPRPQPITPPIKKSNWQTPAIIVAVLLLIGVIAFVNKDTLFKGRTATDGADTVDKKGTTMLDSPKTDSPKMGPAVVSSPKKDSVARPLVAGQKQPTVLHKDPVVTRKQPTVVDEPEIVASQPSTTTTTVDKQPTGSGGTGGGAGGVAGAGIGSSRPSAGNQPSTTGDRVSGAGLGSAGGRTSTTTQYDETSSFREGMARVKLNGKYGFINTDKQLVIPIKYSSANGFFNGVVAVSNGDKWGLIDKQGSVVIPLKYDLAFRLAAEGLIAVELNDKWGFIDRNDNVKIPIKYEDAWSFNEGVAAVKINGKWGFINKYGATVVAFLYDDVDNGYLITKPTMKVKLNGSWFEIDKQGNRVND